MMTVVTGEKSADSSFKTKDTSFRYRTPPFTKMLFRLNESFIRQHVDRNVSLQTETSNLPKSNDAKQED